MRSAGNPAISAERGELMSAPAAEEYGGEKAREVMGGNAHVAVSLCSGRDVIEHKPAAGGYNGGAPQSARRRANVRSGCVQDFGWSVDLAQVAPATAARWSVAMQHFNSLPDFDPGIWD